MKVFGCVLLILVSSAGNFATNRVSRVALSQGSTTLTPQEREALLKMMAETRANFIKSIQGLTPAQWTYKPGPFRWSIAECADHIIMSEDFLFKVSQDLLKTPPKASNGAAERDKNLVARVGDRDKKALNPDAIHPTGKYATPAEAIAEFSARRDRNIEYVKATTDDLRGHAGNGLDCYEFLLLMASHSGRHTAQILEVKASAKYPS